MGMIAATLALVLATVGGAPAADRVNNDQGKPYEEVRADLIRRGFEPLSFRPSLDLFCDGNSLCRRYPELIQCSGVSTNPCLFAFQSNGTSETRIVVTHGETRFVVDTVRQAQPYELELIKRRMNGARRVRYPSAHLPR